MYVSSTRLVSSPDPTLMTQKEGKGSGDFGAIFLVWLALGACAYMDALKESSDLIGQQGCVGDSNLYSGQWFCYMPVASESYDWAKAAI